MDIHERMRDAVGDFAVVSEVRKAGDTRNRQADHIKGVAGDVVLGVHARDFEHAMGITGEDGTACFGLCRGHGPVIAAAAGTIRSIAAHCAH